MGLGRSRSEIPETGRRIAGLKPAVWFVALGCIFAELLASPGYGYFRDELYFLACAKHPALGYVDQPPLSIMVLAAWVKVFGDSLVSIHVPMMLAYAGTVILNAYSAGILVRKIPLTNGPRLKTATGDNGHSGAAAGPRSWIPQWSATNLRLRPDSQHGGVAVAFAAPASVKTRMSDLLKEEPTAGLEAPEPMPRRQAIDQIQFIAAMTTAISGVYMVVGHFYAMNGLDVFISALLVHIWLRASNDRRQWLLWGVALGFGLLNKWSILWLLAGMGLGMLASKRRVELKNWEPWAGLLIGLLVFSPHLAWQVQNNWPGLEFTRNAYALKMAPVPGWQFILTQIVVMNCCAFPLWAAGFFGSKRDPRLECFKPLTIAFYTVTMVLMLAGKSRPNYLSPAYACIIPVAAYWVFINFQSWLVKLRGVINSRVATRFAAGFFLFSGLVHAVIGLPIMPPKDLAWVYGLVPSPPNDEKSRAGPLQGYDDCLGWQEMADAAQSAYHHLSKADQAQVVFLAYNYGEAAALEHYGLPRVICAHNAYWTWGLKGWNGKVAIYVGHDAVYDAYFRQSSVVGHAKPSWAMPEENEIAIRLLRDLKVPVGTFWSAVRRYE